MASFVSFVLALVTNTVLAFAVVLWDERRLPKEQLERAWPPVSRTLAVVAFGPLALPVHFWRTRRTVSGLFFGVGLLVFVYLVDLVELYAVAAAFGVPTDDATQ